MKLSLFHPFFKAIVELSTKSPKSTFPYLCQMRTIEVKVTVEVIPQYHTFDAQTRKVETSAIFTVAVRDKVVLWRLNRMHSIDRLFHFVSSELLQ